MNDLPIYLAMCGFIVMGLGALIKPLLVTTQFGILELSAAGRNEVRAVYGGFGILMGVALLVALRHAELRGGIVFASACALAGMAAGRLVSALIDRTIDKGPLLYLVIEVAVALLLIFAL
jgi:hypothetical protein